MALGHSTYDNNDLFYSTNDEVHFNLDQSDVTLQLYGGYQFNRYFMLEARLSDLGTYETQVNGYGMTLDSIDTQIRSVTLHAVGTLPFGNSGLAAYGQLGAGWARYEIKADRSDFKESDSESVWSAGLGLHYTPPTLTAITIAAGYEIYRFDIADEFEQKIAMWKLGAHYNF